MNQRGFTLLEMIIGMVLLGLILVLLYGGLNLSIKGWDSGEQKVSATARQVAVSNFLHRQLAQVYPLVWVDSDANKVLAFDGGSESLSFAAPIQAVLGPGGVNLLTLRAEKTDEGSDLSFRWRIPDPKQQSFDFPVEAERVVLVKDLDKVELAYFGALSKDDEPAWHDEWRSSTLLPELIRLRLTGKGGVKWPEIIVALTVSGRAGCVWDAIARQCL
jgi:general secretion pathway protein J